MNLIEGGDGTDYLNAKRQKNFATFDCSLESAGSTIYIERSYRCGRHKSIRA